MYLIQPLIWIHLLWRSRYNSEYRKHWLERYGFYHYYYQNKKSKQLSNVVLHAVSVGETLLVIPLLDKIIKNYPNLIITFTSVTPTGLKLAQKLTYKYKNVQCVYLPYDLSGSIKRFIKFFNPKLMIIVETELWPNLINIFYQKKIPIILINARLSYHSFIKYYKFNRFFTLVIERITCIIIRSKEDASRFLRLGLIKKKLNITKDLKFDIKINLNQLMQVNYLKNQWIKDRIVWIAGSTHSKEEELLLTVHKQLLTIFPKLIMIISPRHSERFFEVRKIVKKFGFTHIMKSDGLVELNNIQVIINDTIGELITLYGISDIAFIGGSLVKHGGHNPLEPIVFAIPVVIGPYTFNFNDICNKLLSSHGLIQIIDSKSLFEAILMLLLNPDKRALYGKRAVQVLRKNQGAGLAILKLLNNYLCKLH